VKRHQLYRLWQSWLLNEKSFSSFFLFILFHFFFGVWQSRQAAKSFTFKHTHTFTQKEEKVGAKGNKN
jgi:hypothetical protein